MGEYSRNTIKGHGFKVGETVEYYGMGDLPTQKPTRCVLTKQGTKYVLTYVATVKGTVMTWEFGPTRRIWAAKVDTVTVAPVAQGQTVHNVETDEVFTVTEVTPATVSLRKMGTWRDGVTLPARDVADMISSGTMVIIGNPGDVRAEADLVTSHEFSGHSRRPMECRLCHQPAEVHATTTDEGSSRAMWTKARKEAGMSATSATTPVKVATVEPCFHCGRADTPRRDDIVKPFPHECASRAEIDKIIFGDSVVPQISEGDTVYRERDGHTGIVVAVNTNSLDVEFFDGSGRTASPIELLNAGYGVIPAAEVAEGFAAAESVIWDGTDTLIKLPIRTGLNRRKRKATKRNRARMGGGF